MGLDRPSVDSLRFGLEDRFLSKESGSGDERESERENRLVLRAQYSPLTRLVFQLEAPFFLWKNHLDSLGVQDDSAQGLGDLLLTARGELLRTGGMVPKHVLALTGSVKFPTGANNRAKAGEEPDEHLQLGTGSWDFLPGIAYVYGDAPWALYANVVARLNGENARGFKYGNALFATAGVRRILWNDRLQLSLEGQWRGAGKDSNHHVEGGAYDEDSGGQVLYATAGAAVALAQQLLLRAQVQIPTVTSLNGVQSEHPVVYVGLSYDWVIR